MADAAKLCKCGATLDTKGVCPALCEPIQPPLPVYTGPLVVGSTHIGRMARPVRHEQQGTGYDSGATGHELQGRRARP